MAEQLNYIKNCITKTATGVAIGAGTVVGVNTISGVAITSFGFTTTGVGIGTYASGLQAGIGNVVHGSAFSGFQSIGAVGGGILGAAVIPVAIVGGVIGGGYAYYKYVNKNKEMK
jgi:hypothetical protein